MDLKVEFEREEIVVTRPGTDLLMSYRKAADRPNLILTRSLLDPTVSVTRRLRSAAHFVATVFHKLREKSSATHRG